MGIEEHWLNCTGNCTHECRGDTLYEWWSSDKILYSVTSGGTASSRKCLEAKVAELVEKRWHEIICTWLWSVLTSALAALPLTCGNLTCNWTGLKGWLMPWLRSWVLSSGVACRICRSRESSRGRFGWQRVWLWVQTKKMSVYQCGNMKQK